MAGRFKLNFKFNPRNAFLFGLGGLLMGFGSRFAKGCNIGALYSSIPNFSISGWVFLVAISLGAVVSLKIFEGGVSCLIPARHRDPEAFQYLQERVCIEIYSWMKMLKKFTID